MQTQIALSTMEAEYIALSQSMRELIPIREVLKEIMEIVFQREPTITYHSHAKAFADAEVGTVKYTIPQSTVFEDNESLSKICSHAQVDSSNQAHWCALSLVLFAGSSQGGGFYTNIFFVR